MSINWEMTNMENQMNTTKQSRGFSIASLVLGIISLIAFAIIAGTLAIVFGAIAINKEGKNAMAIAGIITGIVGIVLWLILLATWF